jgi:hypothetical protein
MYRTRCIDYFAIARFIDFVTFLHASCNSMVKLCRCHLGQQECLSDNLLHHLKVSLELRWKRLYISRPTPYTLIITS